MTESARSLTTVEVAALLGVERHTVPKLVKAGKLAAQKLPGRTGAFLFERAAVEALADERAGLNS